MAATGARCRWPHDSRSSAPRHGDALRAPGARMLAGRGGTSPGRRPRRRLTPGVCGGVGAPPPCALRRTSRRAERAPGPSSPQTRQGLSVRLGRMRLAVVGHVEWIRFARVERVPAAGEIAHSTEDWKEVGGGGAVAAIQLAQLRARPRSSPRSAATSWAGAPTRSSRPGGEGARGDRRRKPQRWAFTHMDEARRADDHYGGEKLRPRGNDESLPWHELSVPTGCSSSLVTWTRSCGPAAHAS